jgi:choloylglycine hydrolase
MCTNFKVKPAQDGSIVVGRSMEFPVGIPTALAVLPHNYAGAGAAPQGKSGKGWTASYGVVGMSAFGNPQWLSDGMSTAGLSAHFLYMPGGYCTYADFVGDGKDLGELDVIAFLLGTCSSLADVKDAMADVRVWGDDPGMGFAPPCHILVHDKAGSVAIEFHADGIHVVDNPTSVGTNAPYLDWHLINLSNYVGLSAEVPDPVKVGQMTVTALGQGQGLMGLPGDYTPPGRFVRAATQITLSDQPKDSHDAEITALHILNTFDITPGIIREPAPKGGFSDEVTVWDSIANLTGLRYSYRTVTDPTVYSVDLSKVDFTKAARVQDISWQGSFVDVTVE